jgi:hypothetical protein
MYWPFGAELNHNPTPVDDVGDGTLLTVWLPSDGSP